jgi:hypothetical protein
MGGLFESEEASAPRVRVPLLPVVRRAVLALFAWQAGTVWWSTIEAIDHLARWLAGDHVAPWLAGNEAFPLFSTPSLLLKLVALLAAGSALMKLARAVGERPRLPRGAVAARVDERGLHAGDRLVVARADVARVDVATDADLGFALVVTTLRGATVRIPQRTERSARGLAEALAPAGTPCGAVVFEGVSGGRSRQTRAAALAAASVVGAFGFMTFLAWLVTSPSAWGLFRGWQGEIAYTPAWWIEIACTLHFFPVGVALAAAMGPIARRLRTGSVTVGPGGVETRDRALAPDEIAGVEPGAASDVTLALRDGRKVRLAFGAERALVERDLFVARVRELTERSAGAPTYPAAETSGVRVALKPESEALAQAAAEEEPADDDAQAPRARRR